MNETISKIIGQNINTLLSLRKKKQKELAEFLSVPDNTISYFVSGKRMPNTEQIIKMTEFFNTTADYLLGLSVVSNTNTDVEIKKICDYTGLSEKAIERLLNEWTTEQGVIRGAEYEDEPEIVKNIENEMISKNLLFEVAHKIFEIKDECNIAKRNIKPCVSDRYEQFEQMQEHQRNIDVIMFRLSRYILDMAETICSKELEEFKKIDNKINEYIDEQNKKDAERYEKERLEYLENRYLKPDDNSEGGV